MKRIILLLYLGLCTMTTFGQGFESTPKSEFDLFGKSTLEAAENKYDQVTEGTLISIDLAELADLRESAPSKFSLEVPLNADASLELQLEKIQIFTKDFKVETSTRSSVQDIDLGIHYRGKLAGHANSLVTLSIYRNELVGLISDGKYDYELVKLKGNASRYILYKTADLEQRIKEALFSFQCHTETTGEDLPTYTEEQLFGTNRAMMECKVIEVYLVGDLDFYQDNGSDVGASTNRLTAVFAQTINIYNAENIYMKLSGVFIWTSEDGFGEDDAGDHRDNFRDYYNGDGAGWPGDLAQLISGRGSGNTGAGGIAYFDGLCTSDSYAITRVGANAAIEDWTMYSRFVKVLTHEIGHNLNSRHTHACVWNGNNTTIDDYGNISVSTGMPVTNDEGDNIAEGRDCIDAPYKLDVMPYIMSYFDSRNWGPTVANPFNMTNGMGMQSGNVMRDYVSNASCLGSANLEISCALISDVTVACDEDIPELNSDLVIILDVCGVAAITPSSEITTSGTGCPGAAIVVTQTYDVEDGAGNMASCSRTVTVVSNNGPTLVECPNTAVVSCIDDYDADDYEAIFMVECGEATVTSSGPVLTSGTADCPNAQYEVTWTGEDECGRDLSCVQQVSINNITPPDVSCPVNAVVTCASQINPQASDVMINSTACGVGIPIGGVVISGPTIIDPSCDGDLYSYVYTITDACGRSTNCFRSYTIDNNGPTITAPDDYNIDCDFNISVDADSAMVMFDCADHAADATVTGPVVDGDPNCPGTTYTYTYSVTDLCGRSASDEQVITIVNDPPTIETPEDMTVECDFDIMTDAGAAVVTTSCMLGFEVEVLEPPVQVGPTNCPGTTYTYTYQVTDDCGRVATDEQVFTIGENDPPTITVVPAITIDCFEAINPNPDWAEVTTACNNGVEYEVTISGPTAAINNCPGTTYTYTYTVTDACGRTASADQVFTIENEGPTMECPDNCEVLSCYDGDYEAIIEAWINTVTAVSSCSDELDVSDSFNGVNGICIDDYSTTVVFTAIDECGRPVSCTSEIIIVDTDAPEIYEAPVDLLVPCTANTQGIFEEWLNTQGGAAAYDACGGLVSWSADTESDALDCANGPQAIVVEFTATDECGNYTSITGTFNTKLLPNAVNIAGLIQTEQAEAVASVEVAAYQSTGMTEMDMSTQNGDYHFEELPYEENTEIVPSKDNDYLNGVTTYDLILLQQHILGIQSLNSPYKKIAADANRSGTISTLDLVLLRRLILHIDEELADNTSWRFVDADYVFPNADNPFETAFPETYNLIGEEEELKDFVAVKIGDLNLSAETNNLSQTEDRSSLTNLKLTAEDQQLRAGAEYEVSMTSENFTSIEGFQFTLNFDQRAVEIISIETADLASFASDHYGMSKASSGAVTISWNTNTAQSLSAEDAMFTVVLRANSDVRLSEVLSISSAYTKAEAYQSGTLMNVNLNFTENGTVVNAKALRLYQNQPNPFKDATMIGFDLPKAGAVDFVIYDLTGKEVYRAQGEYATGYNQIEVDRTNLPNGGVFYYHVNTEKESASKKMIIVD